jgi:hypothetical protein
MRKPLTTATLAAATLLVTTPALAQEFGMQGDVSFAADRLMGLYILDDTGNDGLSLGLGTGPWFGLSPYTITRLGIDFFVIDSLSLGGTLAFVLGDNEGPGDDDWNGFLLHPRVGYAIGFSDSFGIWPRGGITFWDIEGNNEVALTAEAMFYATPGEKWGFLFGPTLDLGIAGDFDETLAFGLVAAGVFGWL